MQRQILVISNTPFTSGAEISLYEFIEKCNGKYKFILALPKSSSFLPVRNNIIICYLPFTWFYTTFNPVWLFQFIFSIIISTFHLIRITQKHNIDFVYANTAKANVYALVVKLFTRKKIVWHVRDNIRQTLLNKILVQNSNVIIAISNYIYDQIEVLKEKKRLIYGGIDINNWQPRVLQKNLLKEKLGLDNETILIAQIGQLTRWKNHIDFIKSAEIILESKQNVHFLIIGDDLSGREKKYKEELVTLVKQLDLNKYITFLGQRKDNVELMNQIEILVHPAINEPFGRVLVEAMAMDKPVVAYNCGGSKEIIEHNKTGYLVEPCDYKDLAQKTMQLIDSKELRTQFGKAGRKRVVEDFSIERYVNEMQEVFDNL